MMINNIRSYIAESLESNKEYYINNSIPLVIKDKFLSPDIDLEDFVITLGHTLPPHLLQNVEILYAGEFPELVNGKTAAFHDGAIYISNEEVTTEDLLEDVYHEVAHSLEDPLGQEIYGNGELAAEFLGKRNRLKSILDLEGYEFPEKFYISPEYYSSFDNFLSHVVGYPTLLSLTMGLFASPYGATSLREYFANGFEKYHMGEAKLVKEVSPVLYNVINNLRLESDD